MMRQSMSSCKVEWNSINKGIIMKEKNNKWCIDILKWQLF